MHKHPSLLPQELKQQELPHYIVIEGPVGAGKTSLANQIAASLNYKVLLEEASHNPFLENFYRNPREAALSTQLSFLLQRTRQMQECSQEDIFMSARVADFMPERELLFADVLLNRKEYTLYQEIYQHLNRPSPKPGRMVYLQAPPEILLRRIRNRGIRMERNIDRTYLENISEAYNRFFRDYDRCPLLIVDVAHVDLLHNDYEYERFLKLLLSVQSGQHFLSSGSLF